MEQLNAKFDEILKTKMERVMQATCISNTKTQKMTKTNIDDVDYTAKQTLSKIAAEQDRKYKSSKAYKNAQDYKAV